jgi:predicted CXXCH cytochrome family protein
VKLPDEVVLNIKAKLLEFEALADGSVRGSYLLDCEISELANEDAPVFTIELAAKIAEDINWAKGRTLNAVLRETVAASIKHALMDIVNEHVERAEVEETLAGASFTCTDCHEEFPGSEKYQTSGAKPRELCYKCHSKRTVS